MEILVTVVVVVVVVVVVRSKVCGISYFQIHQCPQNRKSLIPQKCSCIFV